MGCYISIFHHPISHLLHDNYSKIGPNIPEAMTEEQRAAIEVQGVSLPGSKSLMAKTQVGKTPRLQSQECLLLLLCNTGLLLPSFLGIWHGMSGCGAIHIACNIVCLSHRNISFS